MKSRDRERYWSTLFAPADKRRRCLALYAFNAELATSRRRPANRWWGKSACNGGATPSSLLEPGMKTGNPVADALSAAILAHDLPKDRLTAMIAARTPEITGDPPASLQDLRASLLETEGAVFELAASILGDDSEAAKGPPYTRGWLMGLRKGCARCRFRHPGAGCCCLRPTSEPGRGCGLGLRGQNEHAGSPPPWPISGTRPHANCSGFASCAPGWPGAWPAFLPLATCRALSYGDGGRFLRSVADRRNTQSLAAILADRVALLGGVRFRLSRRCHETFPTGYPKALL